MIGEIVDKLTLRDLSQVLTPLKRGRMLKNYIDIGFDTEFTENELISMQFALEDKGGIVFWHKPSIGLRELLNVTLKFLDKVDVDPPKNIFLVTHFGQAELSKIRFNEAVKVYDKELKIHRLVTAKVSQFNKAVSLRIAFEDYTLNIVDLYGHMKTSLAKIGKSLGLAKIELPEGYIEDMNKLLEENPTLYKKYALKDAQITIRAWNKLKKAYEQDNVDPHLYKTFTSLAIAQFRRHMQKLPCKNRVELSLYKSLRKNEWREYTKKTLIFAGCYDARLLACRSYWGGINQAFVRGYLPNIQATFWDFVSLYIIAGILQPLSNEDTRYKKLELKDAEDCEGFCEVGFEFPADEVYPTLPIKTDYFNKLVFPLKGTSYCTLSELRLALEIGVKVNKFRGYGFKPSDNEINHELGRFLGELLKRKTELSDAGLKGSADYQIEKARMVGVIGRFAYRKPDYTLESIKNFKVESGLTEEQFQAYGRTKFARGLYSKSEVGSTWCIEWASLIVGKARSLTAEIVRAGEGCLLVSTDGGVWLGNPHFDKTPLHKELVKYHSGIRFEGNVDELWVARNRLYCTWNKGKEVHFARQGMAIPRDLYEHVVRLSIKAGRPIITCANTRRLSNLKDYIFEGIPLNSTINKVKNLSWKYDGKRKLIKDVAPFKEWTETKPFETIREAFRFEQGIGTRKLGRPKTLTPEQIEEIKASKHSMRILAKKYGVSLGTILNVKKGVQ